MNNYPDSRSSNGTFLKEEVNRNWQRNLLKIRCLDDESIFWVPFHAISYIHKLSEENYYIVVLKIGKVIKTKSIAGLEALE